MVNKNINNDDEVDDEDDDASEKTICPLKSGEMQEMDEGHSKRSKSGHCFISCFILRQPFNQSLSLLRPPIDL